MGWPRSNPTRQEVRRLVDDFRSAREAADGPYRVLRNWFPERPLLRR